MPSNIPGRGIAGHRLAGQMPDGKHVPKTVSDSATYPSQTIDTETQEQLMRMPLRSGLRATTESTPAVSTPAQAWRDPDATERRPLHPLRALFRRQRARTAGLADLAPVSALATPASTGSSGECADRRPLGSRPNLGPAARPDSVAARSGGFRRRGDLGVRGTARRRLYRTAVPRTRRHAPARTDARADGRRPRADDA